jgi:hypothetical protein
MQCAILIDYSDAKPMALHGLVVSVLLIDEPVRFCQF